ncbi:hypothetical protein J7M22_00935, partial [Candidatus Poribacteria bacterium]|nr:hypothetical protein [Candidatus Poribacteria bacterium]
ATTKLAITGAVVMMLAGAGIWLSHRGEEKPMPKADEVKVERRASVRAPARVALSKPKREKEKDEFTFEEFNRLLDECFAMTERGEESEGISPAGVETLEGPIQPSEEPAEEARTIRNEDKPSEIEAKIAELYQQIIEKAEEFRSLRDEYNEINEAMRLGMPQDKDTFNRRVWIHDRLYDLQEEIADLVGSYYLHTEDDQILSYISDILRITVTPGIESIEGKYVFHITPLPLIY